MVDFYFDKGFFGPPFYLICKENEETEISYEKPQNIDVCIGTLEAWVISKLYGFTISRFPPLKYKRFFNNLDNLDVPWHLVIPSKTYKKEVKKIVDQVKGNFHGLNLDYYHNCYKPQNKLFSYFKPAKIDAKLLINLLSQHKDKQGHLKSFLPDNGYAPAPIYTRIGTRTGRLKVKKGPMILNLKKEFRNVVVSRFPGGSIWQLDYSSLEPRVLLAIQGKKNIPQDVYQSTINTLEVQFPRSVIKEALLSRIYGAVDNTIIEKLKSYVRYPEDVLSLVDEYFGIDNLRQKLSLEFSKNDGRHITNFYGRRVVCEEAAFYVLLNYFVQSTAVDISLFGFNNVVSKLEQADILDKIVPIYILHDALFLDVHPKYEYLLPKLCKVGSTNIPEFEDINFYLKAEKSV